MENIPDGWILHSGRILAIRTDTKWTDIKVTQHLRGLSGFQGTLNGNFLHHTVNLNQRNLYMEKSRKICDDPSHKERSSSPRKQRLVLHYYKNPMPS